MKVLFDIVHPADVLFFYHPIKQLEKLGHETKVVARQKDITHELLEELSIPFESISKASKGVIGLGCELLIRDYRMFKQAKNFKPNVMVGFGGVSISHVGKLLNIPSISFYDTETAPLQHMITLPFITEMQVPAVYNGPIAKGRTYRFKGHKDFSYLHPENFKADIDIATAVGYQPEKKNYFIRVVAWNANHDIGNSGWSSETLHQFIEHISSFGVVHLSSEGELPASLEKYRYKGKVSHVHHLIAHCDMYIGESATMACEAVILKVPAICAANIQLGYTDDLASKGLLWNLQQVTYEKLVSLYREVSDYDKSHYDTSYREYIDGKENLSELIVNRLIEHGLNNQKNKN